MVKKSCKNTKKTIFLGGDFSQAGKSPQHFTNTMVDPKREFAENFVGLGFVCSVFRIRSNPNPRKSIRCGEKVAQIPLLTNFFLGSVGRRLGCSSVS